MTVDLRFLCLSWLFCVGINQPDETPEAADAQYHGSSNRFPTRCCCSAGRFYELFTRRRYRARVEITLTAPQQREGTAHPDVRGSLYPLKTTSPV